MITQELLREFFDYQDGELVRIKASRGQSIGRNAGWITKCNGIPYKKMNFMYQTCYLHRMIFLWHYGYQPKYIDHINQNSLDNKIENLREATQSQNCANQKLKKNNTSGYKGVTFRKDTNKWVARITVNWKSLTLGCFDSPEDAYAAYKKAANEHFGNFSSTEQANNRMTDKATQ